LCWTLQSLLPTAPDLTRALLIQFEFRIVSFFDKKPIAAPDSPERTKAGGPFENPAPEEVITNVGSSHRLLVNKYCAYRPMLVLPTVKYAPQTDDLDGSDIAAAWAVLKAFKTPQMVIYNCGANSGSSQGHKHLQLFPLAISTSPALFPARATSSTHIENRISNVPFEHFVLRITADATARDVFDKYQRLLIETRQALEVARAGHDYNVIFTADWIAFIPRRTAVWGGPFGANAAGMLGLVTVPSIQQREQWAELGYTKYLVRLGIPRED
jgi:sulfate adenylyltransferase (ADP) / ATP adenylyltransferase